MPHLFEQNPENIDVLIPRSVTKTSFAPPKSTAPTAKALMDTKVAKKVFKKKKRSASKTPSEITEKINMIKKPRLSYIN